MKRRVPIAFCLDSNFVLLLKVALHSLLRSAHADTLYHVYIAANDLSDEDRAAVDAIAAPFADSCEIVHRRVDHSIFHEAGFDARGAPFPYYYRLALPLIVPEYDKILYSDADVLFFGDLGKYYDMDLGDNFLGVVQFDHPRYFTEDYDFDGRYFASGNMLINLAACRRIELLQRIAEVANTYAGKVMYPDQDCLNVLFYDKVRYLPLNFCVNHKLHQDIARQRYFDVHLRNYETRAIHHAIENPDIVHYTGPKPDKASPSCKVWQLACAQAGLIDEYLESVFARRNEERR